MKRLLITGLLSTLALSTFALPAPTYADGKDQRKAYEKAQKEYRKDRREAEKEYWKERREAEKEYWKDRREAQKEYRKDYRRWARGEYIPRDYLLEPYYVRDYRDYDLAPPPPGYMWVRPYRDDDTYYMVQLATGLISQIFGE